MGGLQPLSSPLHTLLHTLITLFIFTLTWTTINFCDIIVGLFAANMSCTQENRFSCDNKHCIPLYQRCDGVDNCGDGSDENDLSVCGIHHNIRQCDQNTEFTCANRECVNKSKLCNLQYDCEDLSDEKGCRKKNIHKKSVLRGSWINRIPYLLDYSGTCLESTKGGCEHYCLNVTSGKGYSCACYAGYEVSSDNSKRCEGKLDLLSKRMFMINVLSYSVL